MKAKLVKYPFDEKKYRWDTWYQGKEFQYFWDESLPNNFETIEPYIKYYNPDDKSTKVANNKLGLVVTRADTNVSDLFSKTSFNDITKLLCFQSPNMMEEDGHNLNNNRNTFNLDRYYHITKRSPEIYTTTGWIQGTEEMPRYAQQYPEDTKTDGVFVVSPTKIYYKLWLEDDTYYVNLRGDKLDNSYKLLDIESLCLDSGLAEYKSYQISDKQTLRGLVPNFIPRSGIVRKNTNIGWNDDKFRVWRSINTVLYPTETRRVVSAYRYEGFDYYQKTLIYDDYYLDDYKYAVWKTPHNNQNIPDTINRHIRETENRSSRFQSYILLLDLIKYIEELDNNASIMFYSIIPNFETEIIGSYEFNKLPTTNKNGELFWGDYGRIGLSELSDVSGKYSVNFDKYHCKEYFGLAYRYTNPTIFTYVYKEISNPTIEAYFDDLNRRIDENENLKYTNNFPYGITWNKPAYLAENINNPENAYDKDEYGERLMLPIYTLGSNFKPLIIEEDYFSVIRPKNQFNCVYLSRNLPHTFGDDLGNMEFSTKPYANDIPKNSYGAFLTDETILNALKTWYPHRYNEKLDECVVDISLLDDFTIKYLCDIKASFGTISAYLNGELKLKVVNKNNITIDYDYQTPKITITSWDNYELNNTSITSLQKYDDGAEVETIDPYSFGDGFCGVYVYNTNEIKISGYTDDLWLLTTNADSIKTIYYTRWTGNSPVAINGSFLINIDDWDTQNTHLQYYKPWDNYNENYFTTLKNIYNNKVYCPDIQLIGDRTTQYLTVKEGNVPYTYTIGEIVNGDFVGKQLQINAPCEYEMVELTENQTEYRVKTRTPLTFNSYTPAEWENGFHFCGSQWNCIMSPFAYINGITNENGVRAMTYIYEECPYGKYQNIFTLSHEFEVFDNLDNTYIEKDDSLETYKHYWDDNVGGLWYFGEGIVSSSDRNAYPDGGSQGDFAYRLRPQDTKFLRYYRTKDELNNVELISDRYHYTHDTVDFCDRSYEGTICGTSTSTGEDNIPDGTWREYLGLYLGTSIPFLGIVETEIPPADILGVPQYDKQVNTSDTLKYGTVASASLTFTLNKPVGETLTHNNELLILYYDFKHRDEWERLGFFRVDSIEALDENTTSLMAHDEVYKLNKYVDDFLEAYTQTTTLDLFYRDLLNYCGCFYDTHQDIIHNGTLGMTNVYHAVKTTGVQVAHYVANLSPGFIHANIDGDVVLQQYQLKDDNLTIADYTNLVYTAYDTDMLNKIKIVSSNAVKGEDSGTGTNVYFLADNPLLSELQATSYFNELAQDILEVYEDIPTYRPATVDFLILPRELKIGDIVNLTTPKNETYKVIVMAMTISSSGVQIKSFGTQSFPVEAESNSEFVNLINDMGEISGDVSNMMEAQRTMATVISNLNEKVDGFGVTVANNLATIELNGTTSDIATKNYVDGVGASTLASANSYTDNAISALPVFKTGSLRFNRINTDTYLSVNVYYFGNSIKGVFFPTTSITDSVDNSRIHLFKSGTDGLWGLVEPNSGTLSWLPVAFTFTFIED